jgi:hypothetical protein
MSPGWGVYVGSTQCPFRHWVVELMLLVIVIAYRAPVQRFGHKGP